MRTQTQQPPAVRVGAQWQLGGTTTGAERAGAMRWGVIAPPRPGHRAAPPRRRRALREAAFRLPTRHDPAPHPVRLAGMCIWAGWLGFLGLIVAGRGLFALIAEQAPGWYRPTAVSVGLCGIALTIGAFLSVHRPVLPWILLASATAPLAINMLIATAAL